MGKLADYLEKKRIEKEGLPVLYVVKSNRDGVSVVKACQVAEITQGVGKRMEPKPESPIDRYRTTDGWTYDIHRDRSSSIEEHYGSGFGDLWSSTTAAFLDEKAAETWASMEHIRITKQYGSEAEDEEIIIPSC
jgi:hypothetical protein